MEKWHRKWYENHKHPCCDCGKVCSPSGKRCKSCAGKIRVVQYPPNPINPKTGHGWNWKGGRFKDKRGYIQITNPSHPRATIRGYVAEHILIWEQAHNSPVPKGWVVHHLNGIKDDNRPRNLVALPSKKHYLVLQAKDKRIQELEAQLNNQGHLI